MCPRSVAYPYYLENCFYIEILCAFNSLPQVMTSNVSLSFFLLLNSPDTFFIDLKTAILKKSLLYKLVQEID